MTRGHSRGMTEDERARIEAATRDALGDDVPDFTHDADLRGGGDPTIDLEEMDPAKLAARVPRDPNHY